MEIQVTCRNEERREFIDSCAKFFAKSLNITNSRFQLNIRSVYQLRKNNKANGEVGRTGDRQINMSLDSRLSMPRLLLTLAHEMVHVKQIARGQYTGRLAKNGRVLSCWRGRAVRAEYMKRPWEIEAFGRQEGLVMELLEYVSKKKKKG